MTRLLSRYRVKEYDKHLPEGFYLEHIANFPMLTADLVVEDSSSRVILVKRNRNNLDWKACWATPGGRLYRNERLKDAAHRILNRETGLDIRQENLVCKGTHEIFSGKQHSVTIVFGAKTIETRVRRDGTSSSVKWFHPWSLPKSLKPDYRKILIMGGVRLDPESSSYLNDSMV